MKKSLDNHWLRAMLVKECDPSRELLDDKGKPKGRIDGHSKLIMIDAIKGCLTSGIVDHKKIYDQLKSKNDLPTIKNCPISFLTLEKYIWSLKRELGIRIEKRVTKINALFDAGLSQKEIAKKLDTSVNYVRHCLAATGKIKRFTKQEEGKECKTINIRIEKEAYSKLKKLSKERNTSMCVVLNHALEIYV